MDIEEQENVSTLLVSTMYLLLRKKEIKTKRRKPKRFGVHPIFLNRERQGFFENLLQEARLSDPYLFFNFTRMSPASFDRLLSIVGSSMVKSSLREPISPACRLAITLRFLATGDSYPSLSYAFRVGVSTVCNIIRETNAILWSQLKTTYLPPPTSEDLLSMSRTFCQKWSLPNCVGAIDGKHIVIQAPHHSGSTFFNYKKSHSIVLLAVCDADYFFVYVVIGAYGSQSDSGVLHQSTFGQKLLTNALDMPPSQTLPHASDGVHIPFFFVGDEAFPLKENLMRPYSKPRTGAINRDERIYNYRLSRARRVIENAFGIMVARFRILHRVINASPNTVDDIIKAIVCLHNFIRRENNPLYFQEDDVDREINGTVKPGLWRNNVPTEGLALHNIITRIGARNASLSALSIRDYLKNYLNGPGAQLAPWQWETIDRTI